MTARPKLASIGGEGILECHLDLGLRGFAREPGVEEVEWAFDACACRVIGPWRGRRGSWIDVDPVDVRSGDPVEALSRLGMAVAGEAGHDVRVFVVGLEVEHWDDHVLGFRARIVSADGSIRELGDDEAAALVADTLTPEESSERTYEVIERLRRDRPIAPLRSLGRRGLRVR